MSDQPVRVISREEALRIVRQQQQRQQEQQQQQIQQQQEQQQQQKHQGQQEQQRQTSQQQQQQPRQQEQKQQQQTLQQQQQQRQQQLQRQQEQQQQRTSQQQQQQRQQEQQQQQQYRQQYQPQQLNNQQQKVFPAALPRGSDGSTGDVAGSIGWKSDEQGAAWCHDGFADADDDYDDDDDDDALEDDNGELYFDDAYVPQLERYGGGMGGGGMRADALAGRTESRDVTREQHPAQNLQRLPADSVTAQRLRLPHGISITPEVDSGRCKTTPSNTSTEPTFSSVTRTLPSGRAAPIAVVAGSRSSAGTRAPLEKYSGLGADALCGSVAGVQSGVRSTTGGVRLPRGITATLVVDESRHPPRSSASTPEAGVRQRDGVQASGVSSRAPLGAAETLRHPDHEVRAVGGIRQIPAGVPYDQAANDEHYEDEEYHEDFVADEDGDQVIDEMSDSEARSEYFIDGEHGKYIEEENASFGGDEWTHSQYPKVNSAGMLTPSVQSTQGDGRVAGDIRSVNELSSQRSVGASGRSEAAVSKCGVSSVDANAGQKKTRPDNVQTIVPRKSTEKASADCGSTSQPDWSSTQHIRLPPGVTLTSTDASRVQLPAKSPKPAQSSGRETPVHTVPGDKAAALLRLPPGVSVSRNVNISQSLGSDGGSKAKTVAGEVRSRGPTLSGASTPTDTSASRHYSGEYSQQQSGRLGDVAQEYGDETYYDSYEKDLDREAGGQDEEYGDGEGGEYMGEGYGATFADKEYYSETCNISEKQGYSAAGQFYDGEVYDGQQYADSGDHEVYEGEEYGDDDPEEYEDEEYLGDNQKYEGMECESGNGESLQSNVSRNNSVAVTDSVPANHQLTDPNRITSVESPAESSNNRVPSARASSSTVNKHSLVSDTAAHSQSLYKKYNLPSGIKLYPTAPIADSHKESSEMEDGAFEGDQPEGGCSEEEADEFLDEGSDCEDGPSPDYQFPASLTVRSSVPSSTNQRVNAALTTRSVTSRAPHTQASPAVNVSYSSQPSNEFSVTDSCAAAKKQIKPATRLPTSHETLQQLGVNLPKGISIRRQDSDTAALSEADSEVTRDAHSALPSRSDSVGERSSQASDTNEKLDSRDFDDGSVCDAVYDRSSTANKQCARLDMTEGGSPVDSVSDTTHRWPQSDIGTYKKLMRPGPRSARLAQLARLPPEVASSMMRAASGDRNQHLPSDGLFESTEFEDHCETSSVSDGLCAMDDDGSDEVDGHQAAHSVPERSGQICAETANMSDERSDRIVLDRLHDSALSERQEQDRSCGTRETSAAKSLTLQEARALCRQNVERFAGRVGQSDDRVPASVSKSSGCTPNVRSEKLPTAPLADGGSLDKYQKSPEQTASQTLTSLDTRSLMSEVQTSGVVCEAGADCRPGSADADSRDGRASRLSAAAPADIADGTHGEGRPASSQSDHQDSRPHLEKQLTTATALAENYDEEENFGQEGVEEEEEYAAMDEDEVDGLEYNDQHGPMEEYGQPAVDQTVASVSTEIPTELSSIIGQLGHTPIADITSTGPSTTTAVASAHPVEGTAEDLSEVKDMLDMLDEKPELLVGGECGDGGGGRGDIGVECAPLLSQDECAAADVTESVEEVGKQHQEQVGVVAASSGEASSDESDGEQRQELNDGDESEQDAHDDSQNIGKSRRRKRRKHRQKKTKDTDSSVVTGGSVADRADAGGDSRNSDEDDKPKNKRRNIRKILSEQKLDAETVRAQEEELERQQRLADQKRWFEQFRRDQERAKRQLDDRHALLVKQEVVMPSELDDLTVEAVAGEGLGISGDLQAAGVYAKPSDVITLSSDEDSGHTLKTPQEGLSVTVSEADSLHQLPLPAAAAAAAGGESSDDDIQLLSSTEEESTAPDDVDNSGAHTDDTCNVPDAQGRVLINVGHPPSEEDIFLAPQVARNIKSHQIGGVRFLYDNLIESQERCKNTPGFGCILAHSMGLGKTMQTVTFSDIFLRNSSHRLVLIIVPINTIQNWVNEFNYWIPPENCYSPLAEDGELRHRAFSVFVLGENHRTMQARSKVIQEWSTEGGVMLMGYEMYRLLSLSSATRKKKKRSGADDVYAEEREKMLMENIKSALCKPGPDLVICDEGHRIKNAGASISQALKSIRTRRRLALTGYPLQNNLVEYWCMVDFVRPNFLGTKAEFNNMFERPISNGQCADSTQSDIRLMRFRAHVLHSLLEGLVQRRSQAILEAALPKKEEYVCLLRMSPLQRSLYKRFITDLLQRSGHTPNPLRAFIVSCKIWNHPDILYNLVRRKLVDVDLDLDDPAAANAATPGSVSGGTPKRGGVGRPTASALPTPPTPADLVGATAADMDPASMSSAATGVVGAVAPMPSEAGGEFVPGEVRAPLPPAAATAAPSTPREDFINYDWAQELLQNYTAGLLENSTKMQVFSAILDESVRLGDKMLLFSQSLLTLNIIEEFLQQLLVPGREERWTLNVNYYRLDGSTGGLERERLIHEFNNSEAVPLFLVSTRAGSLGVNLVGANRVLVFDASWNPCHDTQAVCRVYRFGQQKKCYIYRLVTDNSMERRIYDRQVKKQSMSNRIVDETNPENMVGANTLNRLLDPDEDDPHDDTLQIDADNYTDPVLRRVIAQHANLFTKEPFEHDKQLVDRRDKRLTQAEKRLAKRSYELEKKASASGMIRPGTRHMMGTMGMYRGMYTKPVANVRPMMTTGRGGGAAGAPMGAATSTLGTHRYSAEQLARQGVTMTHITVPKDVSIPTGTGEGEPIMLRRGQMVLVIKTAKGVYLRLQDGRIIAIRMPQGSASASNGVPDFLSGGVTTPASAPTARQPPTLGRLRGIGAARTVTMASGAEGAARADGVIRLPRSITVERVPSTESGIVSAPSASVPSRRAAVMAARGRGVTGRLGGVKRMVVPSRAAAAAVAAMAGGDASRSSVTVRSSGGTMIRRQTVHGPMGSVSLASAAPPGRVKVLVKPDSVPVLSRSDNTDYSSTPNVATSAPSAKEETTTSVPTPQLSPSNSSGDQLAPISSAVSQSVSKARISTTVATTLSQPPSYAASQLSSSMGSLPPLTSSAGTTAIDGRGGIDTAGGNVTPADAIISPPEGDGVGVTREDSQFSVPSMMSVDSTLDSSLSQPMSLSSANSPANFMPSPSADLMQSQQQQHPQQHIFYNQPPQLSTANVAASSFSDTPWPPPASNVSSVQTVAGMSTSIPSAATSQQHPHSRLTSMAGEPPLQGTSATITSSRQPQQFQPLHHRPQPSPIIQQHGSGMYPPVGSVGVVRTPSVEVPTSVVASGEWGQLAPGYPAPTAVDSGWLPGPSLGVSVGSGPWKPPQAPVTAVANESARRRQHKPSRQQQQQQQQAELQHISQQQQSQHYQQQQQQDRRVMTPSVASTTAGQFAELGSNPAIYSLQPQQALQQQSLQSIKPVSVPSTADSGDALTQLQESCFATSLDSLGSNSGALASRAGVAPTPVEFDNRLRQHPDPYQPDLSHGQPQLTSQYVWPGHQASVDAQLANRGGDGAAGLVGYNDLMPSIGGYSNPVAGFSAASSHQLQPPMGGPTPVPTGGAGGGFQPIDYGGLPLGGHHHPHHLQPQQMHPHEMMPPTHIHPVPPAPPVYSHYTGYGGGSAAPGFPTHAPLPYSTLPTSYGAPTNHAPVHHLQPHQQQQPMMFPSVSQHQPPPPPPPPS